MQAEVSNTMPGRKRLIAARVARDKGSLLTRMRTWCPSTIAAPA